MRNQLETNVMEKKINTIYFILSQPRSGSTLLRLILSKGKDCISLPETHFFSFKAQLNNLDPAKQKQRKKIVEAWTQYYTLQKWEIDRAALAAELLERGSTWKKIFETTIIYYADKYHPDWNADSIWIEKSPTHMFVMEDMKKTYPQAKFIHLIRDPRAVVASLKNMAFSTSNPYTLSLSWAKSTRLLGNQVGILTIKYEDLVSAVEKVTEEIADFLEIRLSDIDFNTGFSDQIEKKNWNSSETNQPVNTNNIDKWKNVLSTQDGEVQLIEKICTKGMKDFGYEPLNRSKNNGYYVSLMAYAFHHYLKWLLNRIRR